MDTEPKGGTPYRLVVRGEIGDGFAAVLDGMQLERVAGNTVITGVVVDQAHLLGLVERIQGLGLELLSVERTSGAGDQGRSTE